MGYYFRLQAEMLRRHLLAFGLPVTGGVLLLLGLFVGGSVYLFRMSGQAPLLYGLTAVMAVFRLSETERNRFLKMCFSARQYREVRLLENGLVALPFLLFLVLEGCFLTALTVALLSAGLALVRLQNRLGVSLPTPFSRRPFEFAVGFRQTILLVAGLYAVVAIAVQVGNFNLGVVAVATLPLLAMMFYGNPEERFYVWVHAAEPSAFLRQKARIALWHACLLTALPMAVLVVFFPAMWLVAVAAFGVANLYLLMMVFAKYADFPHPISVGQSMLIGLSFIFPPLVLVLIFYFFIKARKALILTLS